MKPYYDHSGITVFQGHALDVLKAMEAESVQCCVTSPPYWGLRDYGLEPQIWDGGDCEHEWGDENIKLITEQTAYVTGRAAGEPWAPGDKLATGNKQASQGQFCQHCGAWRGSLGLEPTPELYVKHITEIFREVRRVLKKDGTLWLNLGDSYNTTMGTTSYTGMNEHGSPSLAKRKGLMCKSLKPKDLVGIPWMVAFALRADGWYLRSDIIWSKPNPMPEPVTDRPTKAHEYMFLLAKDCKTIKLWKNIDPDWKGEKFVWEKPEQYYFYSSQTDHGKTPDGWDTGDGSHNTIHREGREKGKKYKPKKIPAWKGMHYYWDQDAVRESLEGNNPTSSAEYRASINRKSGNAELKRGAFNDEQRSKPMGSNPKGRNIRSVWTIATQPFPEAHFATFPEKLIEPCIKAGARIGDTVLDPFWGSGTVGRVARRLNRKAIGIELNIEYIEMSLKYFRQESMAFKERNYERN